MPILGLRVTTVCGVPRIVIRPGGGLGGPRRGVKTDRRNAHVSRTGRRMWLIIQWTSVLYCLLIIHRKRFRRPPRGGHFGHSSRTDSPGARSSGRMAADAALPRLVG